MNGANNPYGDGNAGYTTNVSYGSDSEQPSASPNPKSFLAMLRKAAMPG